ncbi:MAG: redoxin domain-containing protein [Anaerolineae bacterium]
MPKWFSIEVTDGNEPAPPAGGPPKRDDPAGAEEAKRGGSSSAWIISILVTILVLVIAGAAWFLWLRPNQAAGAISASSGPSVPSSPGVPAPLDDLPPVVATVNGDPITREQLTQLIRINQAVYPLTNGGELPIDPNSLQQMRSSLLDQIVNSRLQLAAAKQDGVVAADVDVDKDLQAFRANFGDPAKLDAALARYGLSLDNMRNWIRDSSTVNKWVVIKGQEAAKQGKPFSVESWLNDQLVSADIQYNMKGGGGGQPLRVGEIPPDFTLKDLDGKTWTVSELKGKPVVLNFWATWCAPCKFEMPALQSIYQKYKDKGLVVLAVDIKTDNGEAAVRKYQQETGMTFPIVMDTTGETENNYRVRAYPTSFFIGKDGKLREIKRGAFMSADQIEASVSKIVN